MTLTLSFACFFIEKKLLKKSYLSEKQLKSNDISIFKYKMSQWGWGGGAKKWEKSVTYILKGHNTNHYICYFKPPLPIEKLLENILVCGCSAYKSKKMSVCLYLYIFLQNYGQIEKYFSENNILLKF